MGLANRLKAIRREFEGLWGPAGALTCVRAPGRVNLIGEHTDYNDGFVLPMAIDLDIIVAGRPNGRNFARVYSAEFGCELEFHTRRLESQGLPSWARYVVGAAKRLVERGYAIPGFDAVIHSTLPVGASLSSSAALSIAASLFMGELAGAGLPRQDVARACQRVEHEDAGVKCGIMDQMVILFARQAHALLIDCRTLIYEWIRCPSDRYNVCICDTGIKHQLAATAYNRRRQECDQAARALAKRLPGVRALRDVSIDELREDGSDLNPTVFRRARHVISENQRVLDVVRALKEDDIQAVGRLMNESHESLRNDFEVSSPELDALVEAQRAVPGVMGARLTGAGFGGCTVSLVRTDAITEFCESVSQSYADSFGHTPKIFVSLPERGARVFEDQGE